MTRETTKRAMDKTAQAAPVELCDKELGDVAGGGYQFGDILISSYQSSGTRAGKTGVVVGAGQGGGLYND